MAMKMSKSFVVKLAIYSVLTLYLLLDLFVFNGPLRKGVDKMGGEEVVSLESDRKAGIAGRVFMKPIMLSQVDYAVDEMLWRTGRTRDEVSDGERVILRRVALKNLVDQYILREKVMLNAVEYPVSDEEVDAALRRFASRFETETDLKEALKAFGVKGEKELRYRVAARLQQDKYLQAHVEGAITVSDEEALAWYEAHPEAVTLPERRRLRHVFIARLGKEEAVGEAAIQEVMRKLSSGNARFEELAREVSEDASNKEAGGGLGWVRPQRLPADFASAVFSLPVKQAEIVRTKLGWHVVEVLEVKPSEKRSFEVMKTEIKAALATTRRKTAVEQYRRNLRLRHQQYVIEHWAVLEEPWTE